MQSLLWQEKVGWLIARTRRGIKQEVWRRLRPYGITPPQFGVLLTIQHQSQISVCELAQQIGIDAPTACRIVRNLQDRALIQAKTDPEDRRRFRLQLTDAGAELASKLDDVAKSLNEAIERGLSASERTTLRSALAKIIANMEQAQQAGSLTELDARQSPAPIRRVPRTRTETRRATGARR